MRWRRRVVLAMHVMEHAHGGWGGEGSVICCKAVWFRVIVLRRIEKLFFHSYWLFYQARCPLSKVFDFCSARVCGLCTANRYLT